MKKQLIIPLFVLIAFVTNNNMQAAFNRPITNGTTVTLLTQLEIEASSTPYFALLKPSQSYAFSSFGCSGKIKYIVVDDAMKKEMQNAKIIDDNEKLADSNAVKTWVENNDRRKEARIFLFKNSSGINVQQGGALTDQTQNALNNLKTGLTKENVDTSIANGTYYKAIYDQC